MNQGISHLGRCSLTAILSAFFVSACNNHLPPDAALHDEENSPESLSLLSKCRVIEHDLGKTEICGQPEQVVALEPYWLDLLLSLGIEPVGYAGDQRALVGSPQPGEPVVKVKYLGDRLTSNPAHVGTWQTPSLEAILQLQPDLILRGGPPFYDQFSQIAPTLLMSDEGLAKRWPQDLLLLGRVMEREQLAKQIIEEYSQRVARVSTELEPISRDQKVLLLSMTGLDYIGVFTEETFAGDLLKDLGFQLVLPEKLPIEYGAIVISLEILPQLEADIIIVMASGKSSVEQVKTVWEQNPILQRLPASKAGRVYFADYQLWSRIDGPIAAELITEQIQGFLSENTNQ